MAGKGTERLMRAQRQREGSWRPTSAIARDGRQAEAGALEEGFAARRAEADARDARQGQSCNTCSVGECGHFERDKAACDKWQEGLRMVNLDAMDAAIATGLEAE